MVRMSKSKIEPPTVTINILPLDAGKQYKNASAAESRYMEIARSLGWPGPESMAVSQPSAPSDEVDLENLDDEDEPPSGAGARSGSGGGGMGVVVSHLERDPSNDPSQGPPENSIHGFAIAGSLEELRSAIAGGADVNSKDEYVSKRKIAWAFSHTRTLGLHTPPSCLRSRESRGCSDSDQLGGSKRHKGGFYCLLSEAFIHLNHV